MTKRRAQRESKFLLLVDVNELIDGYMIMVK